MVNFTCNSTLSDEYIIEEPLWKGFTFHHFGLLLSAIFGSISLLITFYLIFRHATHYLRPWEQKHIIRILLMMPIYSTVSFLSYLNYRHAIYYEVLRDCYEAFAIASFFTLLCHYIAPNLHDQKEYFRGLTPVNWFMKVFGLQLCTGGQHKGPFRKPRSGLTWFNVIWIGVFQYCLVRVIFTIVSVLTEHWDRYCEASLSPVFAHVWVMVFEASSVTVAMFCLIQFYIQLKTDLAQHRPFLKVLCIKLVIFFSFWQSASLSLDFVLCYDLTNSIFLAAPDLSFLSSDNGPLHPTAKLSYPDIKVGIPSVLLCIEMSIFAIMHLWAFPWKGYSLKHVPKNSDPLSAPNGGYSGEAPHYQGGFMGIKAFADAFNPWDIVKASARGFRWLFVGSRRRHEDPSYRMAGNSKIGVGGGSGGGRNSGALSSRERAGTVDTVATADLPEDDRAGLLRHSQRIERGNSVSPARQGSGDSDMGNGYMSGAQHTPLPMATGDTFGRHQQALYAHDGEDRDTSYHKVSAMHPGFDSRSTESSGIQGQDWNHWAGARSDRDNARPPSYRTHDTSG